MRVRALVHCTGRGYEDFKPGEERKLPKKLAELLIKFGYAESVERPKPKGDGKKG